jgi:tetratricopeptide (TPR) repeat protein
VAHRTFRLAISPEPAPEVRRVVDFDGRSTLDDVHLWLQTAFDFGADDHLYAFFLSNRYWDAETEYVDPRTDGRRADRAMLFRLGLRVDQRFAYVYDFGTEQRFSFTVQGIADSAEPLKDPVLVESIGDVPVREDSRSDSEGIGDWTDGEAPLDGTLAPLIPLAEAVFECSDRLQELGYEVEAPDQELAGAAKVLLRQLAAEALSLAAAAHDDLGLLFRLDDRFEDRELGLLLLDLPRELAAADEIEPAIAVARAVAFIDPDEVHGHLAEIYAHAGRREEALAQVAINLEQAARRYTAETKAGDVYRALAEHDAAEAYYRRSLAEATTPSEIAEARLKLTSLLADTGREAEASAFLREQSSKASAGFAGSAPQSGASGARLGRNDPCPCGSGKKYKKCHGGHGA